MEFVLLEFSVLVSFRICLLYYKNIYFTSYISYMFYCRTLYGWIRIKNRFRIRTIWSDPDPTKSFGSEQIRIWNTASSRTIPPSPHLPHNSSFKKSRDAASLSIYDHIAYMHVFVTEGERSQRGVTDGGTTNNQHLLPGVAFSLSQKRTHLSLVSVSEGNLNKAYFRPQRMQDRILKLYLKD